MTLLKCAFQDGSAEWEGPYRTSSPRCLRAPDAARTWRAPPQSEACAWRSAASTQTTACTQTAGALRLLIR